MKETKENNEPTYFGVILMSVLVIFMGIDSLITGRPPSRHGVPAPSWSAWVIAPSGFCMLYLAIKALWRRKQKAKKEAEAAILEELEREAQGDVASGTDESESKKDEPPQGGA